MRLTIPLDTPHGGEADAFAALRSTLRELGVPDVAVSMVGGNRVDVDDETLRFVIDNADPELLDRLDTGGIVSAAPRTPTRGEIADAHAVKAEQLDDESTSEPDVEAEPESKPEPAAKAAKATKATKSATKATKATKSTTRKAPAKRATKR